MNLQSSTYLGKPERFDSFKYLLPSPFLGKDFKFVYIFEHDNFPRVFICKSNFGVFLSINMSSIEMKRFVYLPIGLQHIQMLKRHCKIKEIFNSIKEYFIVSFHEFNGFSVTKTSSKPLDSLYGNYIVDFTNIV